MKRMTPKLPRYVIAQTEPSLQVYLLGLVDYQQALALQRRLVYQVAGERSQGAMLLCEHPSLITVGRQGSWTDILYETEELRTRGWQVLWVNRGGGAILHTPGQLAIYPILALDRLRLDLPAYLKRLEDVLLALLDDFNVRGEDRLDNIGVWVGGRQIAKIGVAVREWVSYHGAVLNVNPDLRVFRGMRSDGIDTGPMTSLERERRGKLRMALVREKLVEHFAAHFDFARTTLFFDHPSLSRKAPTDALAASP
jgi:lipoyl(octanoyl) transferase